jgi:hypothetical protein
LEKIALGFSRKIIPSDWIVHISTWKGNKQVSKEKYRRNLPQTIGENAIEFLTESCSSRLFFSPIQ